MRTIFSVAYGFILVSITLFSYTFIDANLPHFNRFYSGLATSQRFITTIVFLFFVVLLALLYFLVLRWLKKKILSSHFFLKLLLFTVALLFFSYPAMLSHDIFNYITTAKVAFFYGENPYLVMPIEFIGDPNLLFTRAANKIALYGPSWILLSAIPHFLGMGNIVTTIFFFKLFIVMFYVGTVWLIWKLSKSLSSTILFALNPLVLVEVLISAHNDIVMMFFALLAFYFLKQHKIVFSIVTLIASILIKYATIALVPLFLFAVFTRTRGKKVSLESLFYISGWAMMAVFLLSPLREEIYPWYVIWILGFAVLVPERKFLLVLSLAFSLTTLLRYVPVFLTGSYFGLTPLTKELVTFVPIGVIGILWLCKKFLWQRFSHWA